LLGIEVLRSPAWFQLTAVEQCLVDEFFEFCTTNGLSPAAITYQLSLSDFQSPLLKKYADIGGLI